MLENILTTNIIDVNGDDETRYTLLFHIGLHRKMWDELSKDLTGKLKERDTLTYKENFIQTGRFNKQCCFMRPDNAHLRTCRCPFGDFTECLDGLHSRWEYAVSSGNTDEAQALAEKIRDYPLRKDWKFEIF